MFEVDEYEQDIGPVATARRNRMVADKFKTLADAQSDAEQRAKKFALHGENKERGYWWGRDPDGLTTMIYLPQGTLP